MPVETEAEWLACTSPIGLFYCKEPSVWNNPRFRWLAVDWVQKVRQFTSDSSVLAGLDGFIRWVRDGVPPSELRIRYSADETLCLPSLSVARCFRSVEHGHRAHAAVVAASTIQDYFPERPPPDPREKRGPRRKDRSRVGIRELLAFKSQRAKWAKSKNAHLSKIGKQFCDEFRDVAGNPFRPVVFDPAWRTETVAGLAAGIDESGAYDRMPILADALEEAGCAETQVLSHAREPGIHVRGCRLVDSILGRW